MFGEKATRQDVRLAGLMIDALKKAWAGTLGGPPMPGSPLASDLDRQSQFATPRLATPFSQAWVFVQTLGLAEINHEHLLGECLLNFANNQTPLCPVTVVETVGRVVLDHCSVQVWLADPDISCAERLNRWLALECDGIRNSWIGAPDRPHRDNPALQQLLADADTLEIPCEPNGRWVGVLPPNGSERARYLISRYVNLGESDQLPSDFGATMHRLLSGGLHGNVLSILSTLLPIDVDHETERPIVTYSLDKTTLWRTLALIFIATLAARRTYALWLGRSIPDEALRLHRHHIDLATRKALGLPTRGGV